MPKKKTLAELLQDKQLLGKDQINPLLEKAKTNKLTLLQVIRQEQLVDEKKLAKTIAEFLHLPFADLTEIEIEKEALAIVPLESARTYKFIPFNFNEQNKKVKVAMIDPQDLKALEALEFLTESRGMTAEVYVTDEIGFQNSLKNYEAELSQQVGQALKERSVQKKQEEAQIKAKDKKAVKEEDIEASAPIIKLVDAIIRHAVEDKASDIHVEPQEDKLRVRYRIDGLLQTSVILPKKVQEAVIARLKVMSKLKIDENRVPQDGRFDLDVYGKTYDFRVSVLPTVSGEKVVMRILDKAAINLSLEQIGFSGKRLRDIIKAYERPYGMLVVTGPTGSGKSTTLYAILNILNKEDVNISTLEDPVEYHIEGLTQSQMNPGVKFTFASGLRSLLRQDPDIIMLGEIRDEETGEMAIHAALTGHVVLSTLHTNTAEGAIPRLVDMGLEPFLLVSSLNVIMAQRLVRRICPDCKTGIKVKPEILEEVKSALESVAEEDLKDFGRDADKYKFYTGKGCKKCGGKGFKGRVAVLSVLPVTSAIQEIILHTPSAAKIGEVAGTEGVISMRQDGVLKALQGVSSLDEVFAATNEAEEEAKKEENRDKK